jgi:cobalt-zinc-cadmium efflux system outer membrane protein
MLADVQSARSGLAQALEQAWRLHPQAAALEAREAEARAAQDIAAGLTPEPGSVSFGSIGDRLNRNQGKQEYEVELATSALAAGTKGGTRSRGEQPHR